MKWYEQSALLFCCIYVVVDGLNNFLRRWF